MKEGNTKTKAQPNKIVATKGVFTYFPPPIAQYAGAGLWVFALAANLAFLGWTC